METRSSEHPAGLYPCAMPLNISLPNLSLPFVDLSANRKTQIILAVVTKFPITRDLKAPAMAIL